MTTITTTYGKLDGVEFRSLYSNGKTDGCLVNKANLLTTPYGDLVPQYKSEDMGRRPVKPLYFHKNGSLKSIALQTQTMLTTPVGTLPAELVTFHKSGSIKRIFPLDGRLSGFWTAKNEFELAEPISIDTPAGTITSRFIGIQFHESGALKSLTLWPGQQITMITPCGEIRVRTGIAFYENGAIRSLEPAGIVRVSTPAGSMTAYDNEPQGIHGDLNSLQFSREGAVEGLSTTMDEVVITDKAGNEHRFCPNMKDNVCGAERKVIVPMKVRFNDEKITLHDNPRHTFDLAHCSIEIRPVNRNTADPVYACAG